MKKLNLKIFYVNIYANETDVKILLSINKSYNKKRGACGASLAVK